MKSICLKQNLIPLDTPIIMGILNITKTSFYDGGCYISETDVLKRVEQILEEGGTIVDLGTVSTKPNAIEIDEKDECESVKKHLKLIRSHFPNAFISLDTFRANVAEMAIEEGAAIINDISGGMDPNMFEVVGKYKTPYILTHNNRSNPMPTNELISTMLSFFGNNIENLIDKGVKDIIIDPGFGFGKTLEQNFYLLNQLETFTILNLPILAGISRKSMIQDVLHITSAESLTGTVTLNTIALEHGVTILRVHDVKECAETIKLLNLLRTL